MDAIEFRAAIKRLGLSQRRAGVWLGLTGRQGQRYASAHQPIPPPVAKLIRLVLALGLKPKDV